MSTAAYSAMPAADLPPNLRWDVPTRCAGQLLDVAYATPYARYVQDEGAAYKRVIDRTGGEGAVRYFRLVPSSPDAPTAPFRIVARTSGVWEGGVQTLRQALRSLWEANKAGLQAALYDAQDRRISPGGQIVPEVA